MAKLPFNYLEGQLDKSKLPHLMMIDLGLPGQHGLDVLTKIKTHERLRSIPVIVNTVSDDREDLRETYIERRNNLHPQGK